MIELKKNLTVITKMNRAAARKPRTSRYFLRKTKFVLTDNSLLVTTSKWVPSDFLPKSFQDVY